MSSINHTFATLDQRGDFDTLIDARSPSEFAIDHVPGAINCPVLNDEERILIGTMYKQDSPFAARRVGAVLVARNVAQHIETLFSQQPKSWKPLVYCWRGGQRSGAFTHILREVGWGAKRLQGGYKTWRQHVLDQLQVLPAQFRYTVIAGPTGSGKTRVLEALQRQGHQVLNLEGLAAHKGSVLGALPDAAQPSQKMFESRVWQCLQGMDPAQPLFVESESRQVGALRVPEAVYQGIQDGDWLHVQADLAQRVAFLLRDYPYYLEGQQLGADLDRLKELCGSAQIAQWKQLIAERDFPTLVCELLERHYDRHYTRSLNRHRDAEAAPPCFATADLSDAGIEALARAIGDYRAPT